MMSTTTSSSSSDSIESRHEKIEQIFTRVEEESARRAQEEAEAEEASLRQREELASEASDNVPSPIATHASISALRQRRRGSVSVSRFGQPTELSPEPVVATSTTPSTRPSRSSSIVAQKAAFYSVEAQHHGSADSLASETANDPSKLVEEIHHSTQLSIAGRQTLSKAITRRLSRARTRSKDILVNNGAILQTSVVIDVAVTQATVEVRHSADDNEEFDAERRGLVERPRSSAAVYSGATLRSPRSSPGLRTVSAGGDYGNEKGGSGSVGWVMKAKDFGAKWKRKSLAALSP